MKRCKKNISTNDILIGEYRRIQKCTIPNDLQPDPKSDIFEETFSLQFNFFNLINQSFLALFASGFSFSDRE